MDKKLMTSILALAVLLLTTADAFAKREEATDTSAEVELDLGLNIPTFVTIQVGSAGTLVDTVTFQTTETARQRPVVKTDVNLPFIITSNTVQGVTLTVDSSAGLRDGNKMIPMSAICWKGTGDLTGSEGCFNGSSSQRLKSFSGIGNWNGSYVFEYRRSAQDAVGEYTGRVTYRITTP